jgi:hypothetical protein
MVPALTGLLMDANLPAGNEPDGDRTGRRFDRAGGAIGGGLTTPVEKTMIFVSDPESCAAHPQNPNPPIAGGEVRGGAWPCAPTPSLGAPKWCRGRACPTLVGLLKLGDGKPSLYTVCRYRRIAASHGGLCFAFRRRGRCRCSRAERSKSTRQLGAPAFAGMTCLLKGQGLCLGKNR